MEKMIWCVLAGALGGGVTAVLAVAILQVQLFSPDRTDAVVQRMEARFDSLDARLTRIEMNSGEMNDKERKFAGAPNVR